MSDDDRKIKARKPADMTAEDMRTMRNILSWSRDHEIRGMRLGGFLDFYHAANDAGYASWVEWYVDAPKAAELARSRIAKQNREVKQ